jgi:hypothetical protein
MPRALPQGEDCRALLIRVDTDLAAYAQRSDEMQEVLKLPQTSGDRENGLL